MIKKECEVKRKEIKVRLSKRDAKFDMNSIIRVESEIARKINSICSIDWITPDKTVIVVDKIIIIHHMGDEKLNWIHLKFSIFFVM